MAGTAASFLYSKNAANLLCELDNFAVNLPDEIPSVAVPRTP
jgi:hypothetical protein